MRVLPASAPAAAVIPRCIEVFAPAAIAACSGRSGPARSAVASARSTASPTATRAMSAPVQDSVDRSEWSRDGAVQTAGRKR